VSKDKQTRSADDQALDSVLTEAQAKHEAAIAKLREEHAEELRAVRDEVEELKEAHEALSDAAREQREAAHEALAACEAALAEARCQSKAAPAARKGPNSIAWREGLAIVRVRARDPRLQGVTIYGHPLTALGFKLDVGGWSKKKFDDLANDPMVILEVEG
jgi:hypothetical protein